MSAPRQIVISELTVHQDYVRDALRALLHTIIFNRAFGLISAKDGIIEALEGISYPQIDDKAGDGKVADAKGAADKGVASKVDESCEKLYQLMQSSKRDTYEVAISFFERKESKGWFGSSFEHVCWETWVISFRPSRESRDVYKFANELHSRLLFIIDETLKNRSHIPVFTEENLKPKVFPFQVAVGSGQLPGSSSGILSNLFASTSGPNIISFN